MVLRGTIGDMLDHGEGGYTPGWYCAGPSAMCPTSGAPGESADTPLLVGVLVAATPRNRRAYLPRGDQLHSDRGEGGDPDGSQAAGSGHANGMRDDMTEGLWKEGRNE